MERIVVILVLSVILLPSILPGYYAHGQEGYRLVYESGRLPDGVWGMAVFSRLVNGLYRPYAAVVADIGTGLDLKIIDLETGKEVSYNNVRRIATGGIEAVWIEELDKVVVIPDAGTYGVLEASSLDVYAYQAASNGFNHMDRDAIVVAHYTIDGVKHRAYRVFTPDGGRLVEIPLNRLANACGGKAPGYDANVLYPAMTDGNTLVELARIGSEAVLVTIDLEAGDIVSCVKTGLPASPSRVTSLTSYRMTGLSDAAWPYIIVYTDGALNVYKHGHGWSKIQVNAPDNPVVRIHPSGVAVLGWVDQSDTPVFALVYLDSGIVKTLRMDGYKSIFPVYDVGYYTGQPVLTVAANRLVAIVSLSGEVLAEVATGIDVPKIVDLDTGRVGAFMLVRGETAGGHSKVEIYELERREAVLLDVSLETTMIRLGEPLSLSVYVKNTRGDPIQGATVYLEVAGGEGWRRIAHSSTDNVGHARLEGLIMERGLHLVRVYVESGRYGEAWSTAYTVEVVQEVRLHVSIPSSVWPAGKPIPVTVEARDSMSNNPVPGVIVDVLVDSIPASTVVTGQDGRSIALLPLNPGTYKLSAFTSMPYVRVAETSSIDVEVKALAVADSVDLVSSVPVVEVYAPSLVEPGMPWEARVVLSIAGVYVEPDSVSLEVKPVASVERIGWDGWGTVYSVMVPEPGAYTLVATVSYSGFTLHASTGVVAVDVSGRLDTWTGMVEEALGRVEDMIRELNVGLQTLNLTAVQGLLESIDDKTSILLVRSEAAAKSLQDILAEVGDIDMLLARLSNDTVMLVAENKELARLLAELNVTVSSVRGDVAVISTGIGELAVKMDDGTQVILDELSSTSEVVVRNITSSISTSINESTEKVIGNIASSSEYTMNNLKSQVRILLAAVGLVVVANIITAVLLSRRR